MWLPTVKNVCLGITGTYQAYNDSNFPDASVDEASNYCRNPSGLEFGPYCYTNFNSSTSYTAYLCAIPICGFSNCKVNRRGMDYNGKVNVTENYQTCMHWKNHFISKYTALKDNHFSDGSVDNALNYCRNPNNDGHGPWCFTSYYSSSNFTASYCGIPICNVSSDLNEIYIKQTANSFIKTLLWDAADAILIAVFPVLMTLGLFLNFLCIVVLRRPSLSNNVTSFLLIDLALMGTLSLLMGAFPKWLRKISGYYLEAYNDLSCRIYAYLYYVVLSSPGWIILIITYERFMSIAKPHKAMLMCSKKD